MGEKSVFAPWLGSAQALPVEKASKTQSWGAQPQQHCRQSCEVFYDTNAPNVGKAMQCHVPKRTRVQCCSTPLPTATSLSASLPTVPLLASQGLSAGTHLSCPSAVSHQASS